MFEPPPRTKNPSQDWFFFFKIGFICAWKGCKCKKNGRKGWKTHRNKAFSDCSIVCQLWRWEFRQLWRWEYFNCLLLFIHQRALSGWGSEIWLGLINLVDDFDDFYNNSSKKLSLVLDELERFLKKGKSSEFNSRHDGDIFGLPIPLWVPWKPKKRWRPQNGKPI